MPTPQFGFMGGVLGVTGVDSLQIGRNIELLELTDGLGLQLMRRISRKSSNEQITQVNAWGITPTADLWPESVSLAAQEESVPHERWTGNAAVNSGAAELVAFDANLIFRARITFTVSGKCSTAIIGSATPENIAWPKTWSSALGSLILSSSLISGSASTPVLANCTVTKVGVDWNQFSYEWQWIISGVSGSNVLSLGVLTPPVDRYTIQKTWTLASEGFGTIQESYESFPRAVI